MTQIDSNTTFLRCLHTTKIYKFELTPPTRLDVKEGGFCLILASHWKAPEVITSFRILSKLFVFMQAYTAIQEGSRRKRNFLVAWMAWTILSKASSELGFTGLPLWSPVHICVDAKLRVDSFASWWAHWEIRLREEGADVAFQNRRNIQGKHQQKSATPALQGDQDIICTSKSRISNVYHTI